MQKLYTHFHYRSAYQLTIKILIVILLIAVAQQFYKHNVTSNANGVSKDLGRYSRNVIYLPITQCGKEQQLQWQVQTERGTKRYEEILAEAYEKYGLVHDYDSNKQCLSSTLLPLKKKAALECSKVFSDYLDTSKTPLHKQHQTSIPIQLKEAFLLNGYSKLIENFRNDTSMTSDIALEWGTKKAIDKITWIIEEKRFHNLAYRGAGAAVYFASKQFNLNDKTGIVIGSLSPWVEGIFLSQGVKKVITAEYRRLEMIDHRMEYVHPFDLAQDWYKHNNLDFAASFSSIEHSGLGRYGDPIDPYGDFREMDKVWCLLKPGGLFFLGIPVGLDTVVFNLHRVYGSIRWPMIAAGYRLLGIYGMNELNLMSQINELFTYGNGTGAYIQYVFVLQKYASPV